MTKQQEQLVAWLNDAHAMEHALIEVLERHASDASDEPEIAQQIQTHLEQTKDHAKKVEMCIDRLGGDVSKSKELMSKMMGMMKGASSDMFKDQMIKNALSEYTSEHMEIASYKALIAAAEELGDTETMATCETILLEEEAMAGWLDKRLAGLVKNYLVNLE
jgi:ferritin-like metal-binding protein YciE